MTNDFQIVQQQAELIAKSRFFKDITSAAQAYVKIVCGKELGLSLFASLTGIHIIKDRPSMSANLLAAQVRKHGYNYQIFNHTEKICEIEFFSKEKTSMGASTFTIDDARTAGLTGDNWKKYPKNMLFARAISNGVRWYCPDATSGASMYTFDEMGAEVDEDGNAILDKDGKPRIIEPETTDDEVNLCDAIAQSESMDELQDAFRRAFMAYKHMPADLAKITELKDRRKSEILGIVNSELVNFTDEVPNE